MGMSLEAVGKKLAEIFESYATLKAVVEQLRLQNDEFRGEMRNRLAEVRDDSRVRVSDFEGRAGKQQTEFEARVMQRLADIEARFGQRFSELENRMRDLEKDQSKLHGEVTSALGEAAKLAFQRAGSAMLQFLPGAGSGDGPTNKT